MTTVRISKEIEFDAGHRVPSHDGKCRNPHGHRYRVQVTAEGPIVEEPGSPDDGMLVDFGDLKQLMTALVHDPLDHSMIAWEHDRELRGAMEDRGWRLSVLPYVPTAENMARWVFETLAGPVETRFRDGLRLVEVAVWETPTSLATYRGED